MTFLVVQQSASFLAEQKKESPNFQWSIFRSEFSGVCFPQFESPSDLKCITNRLCLYHQPVWISLTNIAVIRNFDDWTVGIWHEFARWWLQTFCSTLLGEMIQFDLYFSGLGWNHHLDLRFTQVLFWAQRNGRNVGVSALKVPGHLWLVNLPLWPRTPPQKQGLTIRAYENHRVSLKAGDGNPDFWWYLRWGGVGRLTIVLFFPMEDQVWPRFFLFIGWFTKIVVLQNVWFIMENPIKMDDLGVPPFKETSIF